MPVTPEQAQMLTALALACRPIGAPRWDAAGVMAAIRKVAHLHLADVILAAVNAAEDRSLDTPGAIGNPAAPCWQGRRRDRPQPSSYNQGPTCGWCDLPEQVCRSRNSDEHEFVTKAAWNARLARDPRRTTKETA